MQTATKPNIFEIGEELDRIATAYDQLQEGGTEEELLETIEKYFGDLLDQRDVKLDGYAALITQRLTYAKIRKEEARRLRDLAQIDENFAERLKARLKLYFEQNGITKLETNLHKFAIQNNGGVTPLQVPEDPATLPKIYQIVRIEADTEAIRSDLAAGETIPGCALLERGTHLRIR